MSTVTNNTYFSNTQVLNLLFRMYLIETKDKILKIIIVIIQILLKLNFEKIIRLINDIKIFGTR